MPEPSALRPSPFSFASGVLYLVATPVGNLEDITHRALRLLAEVNLVLCEDTRRTSVLLNHYNIKTRTLSYHEHNEEARAAEVVELIAAGQRVALVSDAGTPAINDPGFRLVRRCIERGLTVVPIPGASAFLLALIASGLPTDEFFFGGFLPARSTARRARLNDVRAMTCTLIFYETPHRIHAALCDTRDILGDRTAVVARELTKLHEEFARGKLSDLIEKFSHPEATRGEMVIVIDRASKDTQTDSDDAETSIAARVARLEADGLEPRAALKQVARELGLPRAEAYRRLTAERGHR